LSKYLDATGYDYSKSFEFVVGERGMGERMSGLLDYLKGSEYEKAAKAELIERGDEFISLAHWAELHGYSIDSARKLVARGKLPQAFKIGRNYVILASVDRPKDRRKKRK
jgi:hypothetical protein